MNYQGYQFHLKRKVVNRAGLQTENLSCAQRTNGCPARLIVKTGAPAVVKNDHPCRPPAKPAIDARDEMKAMLESQSQEDLGRVPGRVWDSVYADLKEKYLDRPFQVLSRQQGIKHVEHVRAVVNGGDFFRTIETEPQCFLSEMDERFFLLFNSTFVSKNALQRICGFAHPELIPILRQPGLAHYIDGTFKVCPRPLKQIVIVMAYDASLDVYVPVLYVLATAKCEKTYKYMLYWLQAAVTFQVKPWTVTFDFEKALINAVMGAFPMSVLVGCLFHWKQAIRRKLVDLRIPKEAIRTAMSPGIMDTLTVIPVDEIVSHGIPYVRSKIDERSHKKAWNTFWSYFSQTWMENYDPSWWNVSEMILTNADISNRTNNPVESYNNLYKGCFENGFPNPYVWLQVTKREAVRVCEMLDQIRKNIRDPTRRPSRCKYSPSHLVVADPRIPSDYPVEDLDE
ncbi:hypothetical protein PF005_g21676 [Phytophthora fragariae]|uniref:MULE transposase domain-containing protein n=1 Tax=Phytophthora fragariae TaxID=53985 RepID=A0A6A3WJ45_9STRA|nr:hypothetical protein PF003_g22920 [Phytophthora fragariae]KAE9184428.1 hypothetical protein PF005_g21676 [Phytophthora fragariae]KAE9195282.1 hypothetical protein PF004_g20475 [Phytophthora fragariae]